MLPVDRRGLQYEPLFDAAERISPLAWQHVNFRGRYRFDTNLRLLDRAAMADQLATSNGHLRREPA